MNYRNKASFGKRQEFLAMAELLKRGYDVYMTLVDDQGIDCILRLDENNYLDIQIKARSKDAKSWSTFAAMTFIPRTNLYFIFFTEKDGNYWILPSNELEEFCYINKSKKNKGKKTVTFPKTNKGKKFEKFKIYLNNSGFDSLKVAQGATQK